MGSVVLRDENSELSEKCCRAQKLKSSSVTFSRARLMFSDTRSGEMPARAG
jgi:hypothetical protein